MTIRLMLGALAAVLLAVPAAAQSYGALAVGPYSGYGMVFGHSSWEEADYYALDECELGSFGDRCRIILRFRQCAAFARTYPGSAYGYGEGRSRNVARERALMGCRSRARAWQRCDLLVSGCNHRGRW